MRVPTRTRACKHARACAHTHTSSSSSSSSSSLLSFSAVTAQFLMKDHAYIAAACASLAMEASPLKSFITHACTSTHVHNTRTSTHVQTINFLVSICLSTVPDEGPRVHRCCLRITGHAGLSLQVREDGHAGVTQAARPGQPREGYAIGDCIPVHLRI